MTRAPATWNVRIQNKSVEIACAKDQTVLNAAVLAGIDYPYFCASGNCGACLSNLDDGEVSMLPYGDGALSTAQRKDGKILACRARPCSNVQITWLGRGRR